MTGSSIQKVQEILDREGWKYQRNNNDLLLIAAYQARKWKMVISCENDGQVCCFAVYPWTLRGEKLVDTLKALNGLNLLQRRGCFLINTVDMKVIYRCGVQILDEYSEVDCIKNIFLSSVAAVNDNWEKIYGIVF